MVRGFVGGLKVGNEGKAQEVFDDLRERSEEEEEEFSEEEYEGVTIYYTDAPEIDFEEPFGEDPLGEDPFGEDFGDEPIESTRSLTIDNSRLAGRRRRRHQ